MKRAQFLTIVTLFAIALMAAMIGCGGDEEEAAAKIVETEPVNGGEMFDTGDLVMTFDMTVTSVTVNGTHAEIADNGATWAAKGLAVGEQALMIRWTDKNGNSGSQEITLTINKADVTVCFHLSDVAAINS